MMCATSCGDGSGGAVARWTATAGSSTSITGTPDPSNRPANPAILTAATGPTSASMNPIRASGSAGSIGRYAAPVFSTAQIATTPSAERGNSSATDRPGPAPRPANNHANRLAASSNSAYVNDRSPQRSATARGARATCAPNNPTTDAPPDERLNTATFPISANQARSSPPS